jgi:hypothetical protein
VCGENRNAIPHEGPPLPILTPARESRVASQQEGVSVTPEHRTGKIQTRRGSGLLVHHTGEMSICP